MTEGGGFLLDSNVLLDIFVDDPTWAEWSGAAVAHAIRSGATFINPVIFGEVSVSFDDIRDVDAQLPGAIFRRAALPYSAAFLAAKAHVAYRRRGGVRLGTLPDF